MKRKPSATFKQIGTLLRKQRESLGLNQDFVSEKLGYKNSQFISNIERGLANVPLKKISDFAKILKMPESTLRDAVFNIRLGDTIDSDTAESIVSINKDVAEELGYSSIWIKIEGKLKTASPVVKENFIKFLDSYLSLDKKAIKELKDALN